MGRGPSRRLALALLLVAAGCTTSPSQAPVGQSSNASNPQPTHSTSVSPTMAPCEPAGARAVVEQFLADLTDGDAAAAAAAFAEGPAFRWYSDATRTGSASFDRATLKGHLTSVAAGTRSVTLWEFDYNGGASLGNFGYVLTKTDTDGSTLAIIGKGAVDCFTGLLVVWSEGTAGTSG